ncbi:MAG TPA: ATP synthase subunit I [Clostridiales bacterium]|nr:ATP synthase subunit I [Clostridiales bacterium]
MQEKQTATRTNETLTAFKNRIFRYTILIALVCELISLPFIGFNKDFAYGLALGTCIAIVNFNLLALTAKLTLERQKTLYSPLGYLLRMIIYGFVFWAALKISPLSALAAVIGFMTLKAAIFILHGLKPKFRESSAHGKALNDLDNDAWAKEAEAREQDEGHGIKAVWRDIVGSSDIGKRPAEPDADKTDKEVLNSEKSEGRSRRYKRKTIRKY